MVQFPPLAQAHTSTVGTNEEEAPLLSVAVNTRGSVVGSDKFQRKMYSPSPTTSKMELCNSPPCTLRVMLSPGSTAVREYTDSVPMLTLNTVSAEMFGGKFSACKE